MCPVVLYTKFASIDGAVRCGGAQARRGGVLAVESARGPHEGGTEHARGGR